MKIRKCYILISGLFLMLSLLSGCRNQPEVSDIVFQSKIDNLIDLAIGPDGEVYAAIWEKGFAKYSPEGDLLEEYPGTENILGLTYESGMIYGYDIVAKNVVEFNIKSKETRVVYTGLKADEVSSMAVHQGQIVLIAVPSYDDVLWDYGESGYINFREKFIAIDIQNGEMTEISDIKHPIALYASSDGNLYVYARPDDKYLLYTYDIKGSRASQAAVMDDVGYLFSFAYEDDSFLFIQSMDNVHLKRMSDELIYIAAHTSPLALVKGFTYYKGNIVFIDQRQKESGDDLITATSIRTMRLGGEFARLVNYGTYEQSADFVGNVTISAAQYDQIFNTFALESQYGISVKYVDQPTGDADMYQHFLTSILAGDDQIDIYLLFLGEDVSRAIQDQGRYVPLTGSGDVQNYLDQCFDWVRDAATTPDGQVWMLPLDYRSPALWYVPENFERFGLTDADVAYFDGYFETVERLSGEKGEFTTHATYIGSILPNWTLQYEMTYHDYPNKVDFNTDLFRHIFDKSWAGWDTRGSEQYPGLHPVLQQDWELPVDNMGKVSLYDYNTERVIFKLESVSEQIETARENIGKWRALPMPRISDEVEYNYMSCLYAFVNPYSKNKELAVAFLEAAAQDMLLAVNRPVFVMKDASAYEGYFDMSLPVYQDIHEIYRDGAAITNICPASGDLEVTGEFQNGSLTLEEAVGEIQRKAEIWLNE